MVNGTRTVGEVTVYFKNLSNYLKLRFYEMEKQEDNPYDMVLQWIMSIAHYCLFIGGPSLSSFGIQKSNWTRTVYSKTNFTNRLLKECMFIGQTHCPKIGDSLQNTCQLLETVESMMNDTSRSYLKFELLISIS